MNLALEDVLKWINFPIIHVGDTPVTLGGLGTASLVFLGFLFVSHIIQKALSLQLEKRFKVSSGVSYAILRFIHYGVIVVGGIVASQIVGLNLGSLAVVFGFLSVGIGFGLQNVTSNFISGLILLVERPISVGDFVSVEGQVGKVLQINMRSTIIMTLDNLAIIVPNSKFVENNVINWSFQDTKVRIHCPVGVAYESDIAKVKETLLSVAKSHPDIVEYPLPEVRFLEFGSSSLNFDLLVWTDEANKQYLLKSQINYAIDEAFRKANIRIPFPQQDLHLQMTPAIQALAGLKR